MNDSLMLILISAVYFAPDCSKSFRKFIGCFYALLAVIAFATKVHG